MTEIKWSDGLGLEATFHSAMLRVYRTARDECGYAATRFLQATRKHGGVTYAKRLLAMPGTSEGFKRLTEMHRLDIAMESIILQPVFQSLFTEEELAIAQRRLDEARESYKEQGTKRLK